MQRRRNIKQFYCQILTLLVSLFALPVWSCDGSCTGSCPPASLTFAMPRATITADTLVSLMKSDSQVTLLECRSPQQQKDLRIPGARVVLDNISPASLSVGLPATDTLIILYPGLDGARVASFSETLRDMGYLSILEYHDGVYGWITYGYEPAGEKINE